MLLQTDSLRVSVLMKGFLSSLVVLGSVIALRQLTQLEVESVAIFAYLSEVQSEISLFYTESIRLSLLCVFLMIASFVRLIIFKNIRKRKQWGEEGSNFHSADMF